MSKKIDWELLRQVSRSFYLTLRVLPSAVRWELCLGYLLARGSDSIADSSSVDRSVKLAALQQFQKGNVAAIELSDLPEAEAQLLREMPNLYGEAKEDELILKVWRTILGGQQFDLERFENAAPLTREELENYTYSVAGCVGEFWTNLCVRNMPRFSPAPPEWLRERGGEFGKALQFVNILRDRDADARLGRIYLAEVDLDYAWRRVEECLNGAQLYVNALRPGRLKFACALPLRLAHRTLARVREQGSGAKISRSIVYVELVRSLADSLTPARFSPKPIG